MTLQIINGKNYVSSKVPIDDKHFINCTFKDCEFEWYGRPAQDTNCAFEGSRFVLLGEAIRFHVTLQRFGLDLNAPVLKIEESIRNVPKEQQS